jgi:hypothetical protein
MEMTPKTVIYFNVPNLYGSITIRMMRINSFQQNKKSIRGLAKSLISQFFLWNDCLVTTTKN